MIALEGLTKDYGRKRAVDSLTVNVLPGKVTGFLGPNGAGKSTTMRMILGLDRPTAGTARIGNRHYGELREPLRTVGAHLESRVGQPGQTARSHLLGMARSNGIERSRVSHVLGIVGLHDVENRRIGTFSLGMAQRLGVASALLGDPEVLVLDEPVNGLDPDGVAWMRRLIKSFAAEGRTVLVSSHLLSEMQETADHLIVLSRGTLVADAPIDVLLAEREPRSATVRTPALDALAVLLTDAGMAVRTTGDVIHVEGEALTRIGAVAFAAGIRLDELAFDRPSLEDAYLDLTGDHLEFAALPQTTTDKDGRAS